MSRNDPDRGIVSAPFSHRVAPSTATVRPERDFANRGINQNPLPKFRRQLSALKARKSRDGRVAASHEASEADMRPRRAKAAFYQPTSKELLTARHMAQNFASVQEIIDALHWNCSFSTAYNRLKRAKITLRRHRESHFGADTTFPGDA